MGKLTSVFRWLATEDKALHAYFMEKFPRAVPRLDKVLEAVFRLVKNPALALIMALILVILTQSGKVSTVNAICAFISWLIAFVWISRSKHIKEMTVLTALGVLAVCGVILGTAGIKICAWAANAEAPGPIIAVGFSQAFMPFRIAPHSVIRIAVIQADGTFSSQDIENSGGDITYWPGANCEVAAKIAVSNMGPSSVFSMAIQPHLLFMRNASVEGKDLRLPIVDLASGASQDFYIVNWSTFAIGVQLPQSAEMQVQGDRQRRVVGLTHDGRLSSLGAMPQVTIDTTTYGRMDGVVMPFFGKPPCG